MPKVIINPVKIETRGGYLATITALEHESHNPIHGTLTMRGRTEAAKWNVFGSYSGSDKLASIASLDGQFQSILKLAKSMGTI